MVLLDTSALVGSLTGPRPSWPMLRRWIELGDVLGLTALVLYEWRRGPRTAAELAIQQEYFPDAMAIPFGPEEAALSAQFYRSLPRARAREFDFAIAACAIRNAASLWTLNPDDFEDIPGLTLARL